MTCYDMLWPLVSLGKTEPSTPGCTGRHTGCRNWWFPRLTHNDPQLHRHSHWWHNGFIHLYSILFQSWLDPGDPQGSIRYHKLSCKSVESHQSHCFSESQLQTSFVRVTLHQSRIWPVRMLTWASQHLNISQPSGADGETMWNARVQKWEMTNKDYLTIKQISKLSIQMESWAHLKTMCCTALPRSLHIWPNLDWICGTSKCLDLKSQTNTHELYDSVLLQIISIFTIGSPDHHFSIEYHQL